MIQVARPQEGAGDRDKLVEGEERRRAAEAGGREAEAGGAASRGRPGDGAHGWPSAEGAPLALQGRTPLRHRHLTLTIELRVACMRFSFTLEWMWMCSEQIICCCSTTMWFVDRWILLLCSRVQFSNLLLSKYYRQAGFLFSVHICAKIKQGVN